MISVYGITHTFWSDHISLRDRTLFIRSAVAGPKQITDVYLIGICQQNGGTLVTLDASMTTRTIVTPHPDLLRIL